MKDGGSCGWDCRNRAYVPSDGLSQAWYIDFVGLDSTTRSDYRVSDSKHGSQVTQRAKQHSRGNRRGHIRGHDRVGT